MRKTTKAKPDDYQVDPNNFNLGTAEGRAMLKHSLEQNGAGRSILVADDGTIIAGNKTYEEAVRQGIKVIEITTQGDELVVVRRSDISGKGDEKFTQLALADNRVAEMNLKWDFSALGKEVSDSDLEFWKMNKTAKRGAYQDEGPTKAPIKPKSKRGDTYILDDRHRLVCGSSVMPDDIKKLIGNDLLDAVVTDPPYNVDYTGKTSDALKIDNDAQSQSDFEVFLSSFYSAWYNRTRPGGVWYVWHADTQGAAFRRCFTDCGLHLAQCLIWIKDRFVLGRQDHHWQHEPCLEGHRPDDPDHDPCLYGWKKGAAHLWNNDRKQSTLLEFKRPTRNAEHPTMKPVDLIAYQISNSTNPGDIVGDAFGGSGTTLIASDQLDRTCYIMEYDPRFVDVIVKRYVAYKAKEGHRAHVLRNGRDISSHKWLAA